MEFVYSLVNVGAAPNRLSMFKFSDKKDEEPLDDSWHDALLQLLEPYEAVANLKDSDYQLSTQEILHGLRKHTRNFDISPAELIALMEQWGFRYENTGGVELEWLLKKKV